jgi:hypothetical protein
MGGANVGAPTLGGAGTQILAKFAFEVTQSWGQDSLVRDPAVMPRMKYNKKLYFDNDVKTKQFPAMKYSSVGTQCAVKR